MTYLDTLNNRLANFVGSLVVQQKLTFIREHDTFEVSRIIPQLALAITIKADSTYFV